ncbi:RNA polymerase sigma factor (sigma-70 family) [Chitinophaga skermanii]|uniref:RNA polymerase sigma factor (Sigma-70 family) n=1 Tax=Chitinophaga skermanii TaxID=331697 RepID=A0A327QW24_9BACT|nr:sigma-70 family RNA polymerase sigma factor [Chitinophaga skermanii]RAJ08799.1 RNA polymerase sigma factor (sigma-70 family) [Chitinophaga skermanii]
MDSSSTPDSTLWAHLLGGDSNAFATIYDRYFDRLYEYAMRLHPEEDVVKDVLQELFIKLWTNRDNLSTTVDVRPYLFVSLRGTLYNRLRPRRNVTVVSLDQDEHDFIAHFSSSSEQNLINREQDQAQQQKLLQALNQLNPRQKEMIYLRYFEELDYEQIADVLNISVKGAYKLSARALKNLRDILGVSTGVLIVMLAAYKPLLKTCAV